MLIYQGKSVFGGIAIGKIKIWKKEPVSVKRTHIKDCDAEYLRFTEAKAKAIAQLKKLQKKALEEVGKDNAAIFDIHILMLEDADYLDAIKSMICTQSLNAEYAVMLAAQNFSKMFSAMNDAYMQARATDVKDISDRVINILSDISQSKISGDEPIILVADELTPSQTVQFDKSRILAFVTSKGSLNSHTAILARTMNIPAIIGVDIYENNYADGKMGIVDGYTGNVYIEPEEEFLSQMKTKLDEQLKKRELLQLLKGKEDITLDGKKIKLYANMGNIKDLPLVLFNDAEGIGLFRSEFIYLESDTAPGEEEQFAIYKTVAETMAGKKVIIRTLDIGADKKVEYLGLKEEENPALGLRGIRLCFKRQEIFKTQLRALLRASVYGNISVMYPMIISLDEIHKIKAIVSEVASELSSQKIPFAIPEQGIMIETPASVMVSDKLAKEVSFFSIGTNDLSQYTLAIDRQNEQLDDFFDPHSEAVLKMIEMTVKSAHDAGIWVGICGELAADTSLTEKFLRMGVDELSVSPSMVLSVRKKIRETNLSK
ncbi:MAG: phosphoenolpyruvate--protein phosphotransferase [Clostridia bacterium]|nr:phosphoenolpyruvate--protein phosphotransferase [Clostridia bacterium]